MNKSCKNTRRNLVRDSKAKFSSQDFELTKTDQVAVESFLSHARTWSAQNQWAVGVSEVALGASILAWGIQSGAIEFGTHLVGSALSSLPGSAEIGAMMGVSMGATAAAFIGSIGIVGMGSAIAVPALMLIGAGATVFGAFGYTVGDLTEQFLQASYGDVLAGGSAALVGVALILDGCQRLMKDDKVIQATSNVRDGIVRLTRLNAKILASSVQDIQNIARAMTLPPENPVDAVGSVGTGLTMGAAGTAAGAAVAASTVTVLGSGTLGSAAVALGLVSAPLWPLLAGGSAGLAVGYGLWKAARHYSRKVIDADTALEPKLLR